MSDTPMTATYGSTLRQLLNLWTEPSSDAESARQERALRMIKDAVNGHPPFRGVSLRVYAKGSYPNNTNVRLDSDVDIVVENRECFYYDAAAGVTMDSGEVDPYCGPWTPPSWRREVQAALTAKFGATGIDTDHNVAILVKEVPGSRPSADVVPSFGYISYQRDRYYPYPLVQAAEGSAVHPRDGAMIVNWPQQQLDNGRAKNVRTGKRYKRIIRVLKNSENFAVEQGWTDAKPSYLMECLIWNVPDEILTAHVDIASTFQGTLLWLFHGLNEANQYRHWTEPNEMKLLFGSHQKWTPDDALEIVVAASRIVAS